MRKQILINRMKKNHTLFNKLMAKIFPQTGFLFQMKKKNKTTESSKKKSNKHHLFRMNRQLSKLRKASIPCHDRKLKLKLTWTWRTKRNWTAINLSAVSAGLTPGQ
jgi:hypothetical protein